MQIKEKKAVVTAALHVIKALEHITDSNVRNHLTVALVELKLIAPKDVVLDDLLSVRIHPVAAVKKPATKKAAVKKAVSRGRRKK